MIRFEKMADAIRRLRVADSQIEGYTRRALDLEMLAEQLRATGGAEASSVGPLLAASAELSRMTRAAKAAQSKAVGEIHRMARTKGAK